MYRENVQIVATKERPNAAVNNLSKQYNVAIDVGSYHESQSNLILIRA